MAIRITVTSTGMEFLEELDTSLVTLRTVVPLDRVMPPADLFAPVDETDSEEDGDLDGGAAGGTDAGGDSGEGEGGESGDPSSGPGGRPVDGPGTITDPDGGVHKLPPSKPGLESNDSGIGNGG